MPPILQCSKSHQKLIILNNTLVEFGVFVIWWQKWTFHKLKDQILKYDNKLFLLLK